MPTAHRWLPHLWPVVRELGTATVVYLIDMDDHVAKIADRLRNWPKGRQEDAAELLRLIEEHDQSPYELTDGQASEVRRRLATGASRTLTLAQLDDRLRLLGV